MGRPVTRSIGIRHRMDKPETQASLKQDREWTNHRHRQHEKRQRMDKPETQAILRQDT